jgi:hypothetical protein
MRSPFHPQHNVSGDSGLVRSECLRVNCAQPFQSRKPSERLVRFDNGVDEFPGFQVHRTRGMERVKSPQSMSWAIRVNKSFRHFVVTGPEGLHAKPAHANVLTKTLENQDRIGR